MSTKHFFPETSSTVQYALQSFTSRNPHLGLDETNRVVYSKTHAASKVTLVSGGGSGHEPAWSGYVGDGMLAAAVSGDVFASPSTKQVMAAVERMGGEGGVILCITNYTGDRLHFGLAREKATGMGYKCAQLPLAEDASLGRKKSELVGRRGLAANIILLKMLGAAAESGWTFEQCVAFGPNINEELVTIGTSLDHCHVMGRTHHEHVPDDTCVLGMGVHNEPGLRSISPMPAPEELVDEMLRYLCDPNDSDRAFVTFKDSDDVALLVNNLGGVSMLEMEALTHVTLQQLEKNWKIKPVRTYAALFETSLNGPGFSISLANLSGIARAMKMQSSEIIALLDAPTTAPAWPKNSYGVGSEDVYSDGTAVAEKRFATIEKAGPQTNPEILKKALTSACKAAIAAEPDITKFDIQMGDGDCGEAVEGVCKAVLAKIDSGAFDSGSLFEHLDIISNCVEDVGGSLGAILNIMLTGFSNALRDLYAKDKSLTVDFSILGDAAVGGLRTLEGYTGARKGDRTVMDALIPFCETLKLSANLEDAVKESQTGAANTAKMTPKFGRASYVGEKAESGNMPPDPGAHALGIFLDGLAKGVQ